MDRLWITALALALLTMIGMFFRRNPGLRYIIITVIMFFMLVGWLGIVRSGETVMFFSTTGREPYTGTGHVSYYDGALDSTHYASDFATFMVICSIYLALLAGLPFKEQRKPEPQ